MKTFEPELDFAQYKQYTNSRIYIPLPPIYHLPVNVISATVSFVYIILLSVLICSPNMDFLARLILYNSRSLEKFELGALGLASVSF